MAQPGEAVLPNQYVTAQVPQAGQDPMTEPYQPPGPTPIPQNLFVGDDNAIYSVDPSQIGQYINAGYRQATPDDIQSYVQAQKYGTLPQQAITAGEGAANAATFGFSTGAERMLGVPREDILGRRAENPIAYGTGQVAGLAGSAFFLPEIGAAAGMAKAGEGASDLLGLGAEGSGLLSKVGSSAVKGAVESSLFQMGDENAKMLAGDPNESAQTALVNVGLSGLIGAGLAAPLGAISPLWEATKGTKLGVNLSRVMQKLGGDDSGLISDNIRNLENTAGYQVDPNVRAGLLNDPEYSLQWKNLREGQDMTGEKIRTGINNFYGQAGKSVLNALGKTPDDIESLPDISNYDLGTKVRDAISKSINDQYNEIKPSFDYVHDKYFQAPLFQNEKDKIADQLSQLAIDDKYIAFPDSPQLKLIRAAQNGLGSLRDVSDLTNFQSRLFDQTSDPSMWDVGKKVRGILRNAEGDIVDSRLASDNPELSATHANARIVYKGIMDTVDDTADRLGIRRYAGPGSFITKLGEMDPEDILRKIAPSGKWDAVQNVAHNFPEVANIVKENELNKLLKAASGNTIGDSPINVRTFYKKLMNLSPEMRQFILPQNAQPVLDANHELINMLSDRVNPSGTGGFLKGMQRNFVARRMLGMTGGALTSVAGVGFVPGFIAGELIPFVGNASDAVNLAMLKFLATDGEVSAPGFKAAADYITSMSRGENALANTTASIFHEGRTVLPSKMLPTPERTEKLDKKLQSLQKDPTPLMNTGGQIAKYLPNEHQSLVQTAASSVNYLNSQRPVPQKAMPLDNKQQIPKIEKAKWQRKLEIAEQPLVAMNGIKDGSITQDDVNTLKTLYPGLYQRASRKIIEHISEAQADGKTIPYKTRIGLATFLGSPLDSTQTQASIAAAQVGGFNPNSKSQQVSKAHVMQHGSMQHIGDIAKQSMTVLERREMARGGGE